MGKEEYRFKLSDLMPNSLFYKLKDMRSRGKKEGRGSRKPAEAHQNSMNKSQIPRTEPFKSMPNQRRSPASPPTQPYTTNRPSYYIPTRDRAEKLPLSPINRKAIDTAFPLDSPRKTNKKHKEKPLNSSSNLYSSSSPVFTCRNPSSSALSSRPFAGHRLHGLGEDFKDDEFISSPDYSPNPPLPPVLTKPRLLAGRKQSPKQGCLISNGGARRSPSGSLPIKMRIKSPKLVKKMAQQPKRKGLAESFVVVKSSSDPQREFRESMVEMIVENNLCSLKELEELLACYLSLNSSEYHDLIVKVFKQIWLDLTELLLLSQ